MGQILFSKYDTLCKHHRYGGREVLRVVASAPQGESAAALHMRAIIEELQRFALEQLFPKASRALAEAAARGMGYAFSPWRYEIFCKDRPVRGLACVEVTAMLWQNGQEPQRRVLVGYWTRDGALQRPAPRFWGRKRSKRRAKA